MVIAREGCAAKGCRVDPGTVHATCAYVDQWGWRCGEPCCAGHGLELSGATYCHPHAGLFLTLGGDKSPLPCEFDDPYQRRPSLATWLPRDLDADMRDLLTRAAGVSRHTALLSVTESVGVADVKSIAWDTRWQIVNSRPRLSVSFVLEGYRDPALVVAVGDVVVLREVPEWLPHHIHGGGLDAETEAAMRVDLLTRCQQAIAAVYAPHRNEEEVAIELAGLSFLVMSRTS